MLVGPDGRPLPRQAYLSALAARHGLVPATEILDNAVLQTEAAAMDSAADHDVLYHITDNPHFALNPNQVPDDNTFALQERKRRGLYVTPNPDQWLQGEGYVRPYLAEIHVPKAAHEAERWSGEHFIPAENFGQAKVHRVIPVDAYIREEYGQPGWIEQHHGTAFDTGQPLNWKPWEFPYRGQRYTGPDAREMTPEQHAFHKQRALDYLRDNNGHSAEDVEALGQSWAALQQTADEVEVLAEGYPA